jgi:hypothetical protein
MIVKPVLAGALALALSSHAEIDFGPVTLASNPYVAQVICEDGRGTAFKIEGGQWVTVRHVSANGGCTLNGRRVYQTHADQIGDFALIDNGDSTTGGLKVDCGGFRDGEWYHGIGFGQGVLQSKSVRYSLFHTLLYGRASSVLFANRFVPGMSGGPVLNAAGEVVGTVNAYGIEQRVSFSRELKRTKLC